MWFGDSQFRIVVEGFERSARVGDSQMFLWLEGPGWRVGGEDYESFGVVVPKLVAFGRNGAARHWGAFDRARTPSDVIERVTSYVFPPGIEPSGPWHWEISSALFCYVLSGLFDSNLGEHCVVAVRGRRHETIIVQSKAGAVQAHDVPVKSFDRAIDGLCEWMQTLETS